MQFARAVRGSASACLVLILTACGGGGGGDDAYPADDTIVVKTSTAYTAAGSYHINTFDTATSSVNGQTLEHAAAFSNTYWAGIDYVQAATHKFVLWMEDDSGYYACRSSAMDFPQAAYLMVCDKNVEFNALAHTLRFNDLTLREDDGVRAIKASANLSW